MDHEIPVGLNERMALIAPQVSEGMVVVVAVISGQQHQAASTDVTNLGLRLMRIATTDQDSRRGGVHPHKGGQERLQWPGIGAVMIDDYFQGELSLCDYHHGKIIFVTTKLDV